MVLAFLYMGLAELSPAAARDLPGVISNPVAIVEGPRKGAAMHYRVQSGDPIEPFRVPTLAGAELQATDFGWQRSLIVVFHPDRPPPEPFVDALLELASLAKSYDAKLFVIALTGDAARVPASLRDLAAVVDVALMADATPLFATRDASAELVAQAGSVLEAAVLVSDRVGYVRASVAWVERGRLAAILPDVW